jgi:mannitol-specific phosphotransferase system IIBC component
MLIIVLLAFAPCICAGKTDRTPHKEKIKVVAQNIKKAHKNEKTPKKVNKQKKTAKEAATNKKFKNICRDLFGAKLFGAKEEELLVEKISNLNLNFSNGKSPLLKLKKN